MECRRVQYAYGAVDMHSVRMAYVFDVHAKYIYRTTLFVQDKFAK